MLTNNKGQSDIVTHKTNTEIKESTPNTFLLHTHWVASRGSFTSHHNAQASPVRQTLD
jgi:hypothetical protein